MKQDNTTKAIISAIILVMGIFGQSAQKPQDNVGNNNVDSILNEVNLAFDLAEKNILKSTVKTIHIVKPWINSINYLTLFHPC